MASSRNPFDDDDDWTGANGRPTKSYTSGGGAGASSQDNDQDYYEREIERHMQASLDSTNRARNHLEDSQRLGIATAQNLLEQREKLERTEHNLDQIKHTTAQTQRNLNSLKSVFGGYFKNKFSRAPKDLPPPPDEMPKSKSTQRLDATVTSQMSGSTSVQQIAPSGRRTLNESSREAIRGTRWEEMDNQIEENLDDMSVRLNQLKALGKDLGNEVEDQNRMLDRIHSKADANDATVRAQDAQMKKLLGYGANGQPVENGAASGESSIGQSVADASSAAKKKGALMAFKFFT